MKFSKLIGLFLLIIGITIILYSLYSSYNIFTVKSEVPEIFSVPKDEGVKQTSKKGIQDLETQMKNIIGEQLKQIIPAEYLSKLFNLIAWSIFAFILIFGGTQISVLGIKLIIGRS